MILHVCIHPEIFQSSPTQDLQHFSGCNILIHDIDSPYINDYTFLEHDRNKMSITSYI